eukprot:SAG11_NODE_41244_length_196_cov_43.020619_1_plen_48_part_10
MAAFGALGEAGAQMGGAGQQRGFRRWASKEGGKSSTWVMGRELHRGAS